MAELKLYTPILVRINEPGEMYNSINDLPEEDGTFHIDTISKYLKESLKQYGDEGLAGKIYGPVGEKVTSAIPGVEAHNGSLYGTITFTADTEFTRMEVGLLTYWTYDEFATGWGDHFEAMGLPVKDGEIHVSFFTDIYDFTLETADEFFGNLNSQSKTLNPQSKLADIHDYSCYDAELIATYEEVYEIPNEDHVTSWWGDLAIYEFKYDVEIEKIQDRFEKALKAVNMTREEFNNFRYVYRQNLINQMKENMPERYEVITLFDKPVLMDNGRIDAQNVPPDMFAYELRHDDGGDMCSIEKSVKVNFAGTILSKEEIEMNGDYKKIDYDDYNFLGLHYSADEYLDHYEELVEEYCEPELNNGMSMQ